MDRSPWPDFFVIGAGKSGTTTLYEVLRQHPQVHVSAEKEPNYFSDAKYSFRDTAIGKDEYLALYRDAGEHRRRGDFSTSYFLCPQAPARIREHNKAARFIVILRDPISRAFSDYLMFSRRDKLIHRDFITEVRCELDRLRAGRTEWPFLVKTGLYYTNIRNFLDHFPKERFLFLTMNDLNRSPRCVYRRVCEFIDIDVLPISEQQLRKKRNRFAELRSTRLRRLLSGNRVTRLLAQVTPAGLKSVLKTVRQRIVFREAERPKMPEAAWPLLQSVFEEDLRSLQALIGFDVSQLQDGWPRRQKKHPEGHAGSGLAASAEPLTINSSRH
jgi:hypothetical protein